MTLKDVLGYLPAQSLLATPAAAPSATPAVAPAQGTIGQQDGNQLCLPPGWKFYIKKKEIGAVRTLGDLQK